MLMLESTPSINFAESPQIVLETVPEDQLDQINDKKSPLMKDSMNLILDNDL